VTVFRVPDDEYAPGGPTAIGIQGGRSKYPAQGVFGGGPGSRSKFLINGISQDPAALNFANPGDVITFCNPRGGGYGDPLDRDPKLVEQDVINEYVSLEKAREDYGVVINPGILRLDPEATRELRDSMTTNDFHALGNNPL